MKVTNIVPCKGCGIKVPYTDLKPSAASKVWVCQNCINKEIKSEDIKRDKTIPSKSVKLYQKESSYKCEKCGHKVRSSADLSKGKMCPFCGEKGMMKVQKTSTQILKEVESLWGE